MKTPLSVSILLAAAVFSHAAWTQTHGVDGVSAPAVVAAEPGGAVTDGQLRGDQRIEHLNHQDSGSTINELRVGGESESITVKPNTRAPAYQITPERTNPTATSGQRMWNVLKF